MNQVLKDAVYTKGSDAKAVYMAKLGGMNEEETKVFMLLHQGKADAYIQDVMDLTRPSYERIEESIRAKLLLAVFDCIDRCFYNE